jgi:hypothetical protein
MIDERRGRSLRIHGESLVMSRRSNRQPLDDLLRKEWKRAPRRESRVILHYRRVPSLGMTIRCEGWKMAINNKLIDMEV